MPLFKYKSFTRSGKQVEGTIDATSAQGAKELLQGQGLMPVDIRAATSGDSFFSRLFAPRVDEKTVIMFTKQLSVLQRSGVPLLQSIEMLAEQFEDPMHSILLTVKEGLKGGESLATLLEAHPKAFSNVYVQLVRAGEASGKLDVILARLVDYLSRSSETRKKVKKALQKPMTMIGMLGLIVIGLLGVVVPRLSDLFAKGGKELPAPTQVLMALSNAVTQHYILLLVMAIAFIIAFIQFKSSEYGARKLDELVLRIPVISYFARTKAVVQFSQTLGMLMESGVNLAQALDIVSSIVENKVLTQQLQEARDNIIKEGRIARYLADTGLFPKMASYMISTGEESGKLAEMLSTVGRDYDEELSEFTESLTGLIDPIMTLVIGGTVLFIIIAIMLPIMQMGDMAGI